MKIEGKRSKVQHYVTAQEWEEMKSKDLHLGFKVLDSDDIAGLPKSEMPLRVLEILESKKDDDKKFYLEKLKQLKREKGIKYNTNWTIEKLKQLYEENA